VGRYKRLIIGSLLLTSPAGWADEAGITPSAFQLAEEEDGAPSCAGTILKVSNTSLTDNADGSCSVSTSGGSGDVTAVGDVTSGAAFDGTQGTTLTFNDAAGDQTLLYNSGGDLDFNFSDDLTLRDATPHLQWLDTTASHDDFEAYADASQWYLTNVTDAIELLRYDASYNLHFRGGAVAYDWPTADGSNGQFLRTNASGGLSWATGSGGNSFETMAVPAGASVVADTATDTLTLTEDTFLTLTGTAATDTIAITQVTTDLGTDGLIAANAVALTTDTTGNYAAGDAEAGAALTGDTATAFFSLGTLEHERGGLEADVSAYDGLVGVTGGATYNQTGTTTQIIIFDGAGAPTSAALSGDVTMTNGGVVSIAADSVALTTDTTGNYVAAVTTSVLTGLTGGNVAAEGTTSALAFDYSQALSGDVGLGANATVFGVTGLVAEGATADTIELFLAIPDPVTTDKTITLFNATDTVVGKATTDILTNKTIAAADNVVTADDTICTDCLNATEIEDLYTLNTGDTITGAVTINDNDAAGSTLLTIGDATDADSAAIFGDLTITGGDLTLGTTSIFSGGDTASLNNVDAVDATTEATIEAAIDTLANLASGGLADNTVVDADLAITESMNLFANRPKITGAFVVRTPTSGDASTQGAAIDAGDGNWRLLFDPTTDEAVVWEFRLPDYWGAHGEVNIQYSMTSATANEVDFEVDVMCVTPGDAADIGIASFAGVATASDTVPGTAGYLDEVSVTVTDDACAPGDLMWLYLSKDANDATLDDATGDTEVVGVEYEFTR